MSNGWPSRYQVTRFTGNPPVRHDSDAVEPISPNRLSGMTAAVSGATKFNQDQNSIIDYNF